MRKIFFVLIVFFVFSFVHNSWGLEKYSFGLKYGINYNKIHYEEKYIYEVDEYSYPRGFTAGIYLEIPISKRWSVVNEIDIQKSYMKMHVWTDTEMIDQDYEFCMLCVPVLLKYDPHVVFLPFIIAGPNFEYPISAIYNSTAVFCDCDSYNDLEIRKDLRSLGASAVLDIGKKVDISSFSILFQIRGQISITKNKLSFAPEWYTKSISYFVGLAYNKK